MTTYLVTGDANFLGFAPGATFVAQLEGGLEERALKRGSIKVVERSTVTLDETRVVMPRGWKTTSEEGA